jgi:hypothetical protein
MSFSGSFPRQIVDAPPPWIGRRFAEIAYLEIGKALFVPWADLDDYEDAPHTMRMAAWTWSRRLGRKFGTRKGPAGMYVIRRV